MEEARSRGFITEVFGWNFKEEASRFLCALSTDCNTIAFDTEYPGTLVNTPQFADEVQRYKDTKFNVEKTNLIQVGFTVFNPVTSEIAGVWQFNLSGFNPKHHAHNSAAIKILRQSGINFRENNSKGVKISKFANLVKRIRSELGDHVQWITFHGMYDIAYLLAAVNGRWKLPEDIKGFNEAAGELFNGGIFDLKCMAGKHSYMGLEKLAALLGTTREEGCAHQSGSDSLLTAKAFIRALQCSLVYNVEDYRGCLFGISHPIPFTGHSRYVHVRSCYIPVPAGIPVRCIPVRYGDYIVMQPCYI